VFTKVTGKIVGIGTSFQRRIGNADCLNFGSNLNFFQHILLATALQQLILVVANHHSRIGNFARLGVLVQPSSLQTEKRMLNILGENHLVLLFGFSKHCIKLLTGELLLGRCKVLYNKGVFIYCLLLIVQNNIIFRN